MIRELQSDAEILSSRDVMLELRPHIPPDEYVATVRRMMQRDGYRLAASLAGAAVTALAGYRFMEMLHCGRILYVDDLVTSAGARSGGHGRELMDWLKAKARAEGCGQLHLDSGVHREAAHRFYFRERLAVTDFHFRVVL
jgi:GNAT superfamily N-acetyltransferase